MPLPYMRNVQAMLRNWIDSGAVDIKAAGAPISGLFSSTLNQTPTGLGVCGPGSIYTNVTNGVQYFNEGTAAAPYWTPVNILHRNLLSWETNFRDGVGNAIAATTATVTIAGSGLRNFGTGIEETDSGLVPAIDEDGPIATMTASATDGKVAALGVGITTSVPFQPDSHGPLVVEARFAVNSALTSRRVFMGFIGTAADALANPVTGATVTITLVQDDVAGMLMDSGLTAATEIFAPHNKSDEAATILTTATGVDCGVVMPAAGTYVRWRVEISAAGIMTCFQDKVQVTQISAALDTDEEVAPVLLIGSKASATKALLIKQFAAWGNRN